MLAVGVLLIAGAGAALAQEPTRDRSGPIPLGDSIPGRVVTISPHSGPAGTEVTVRAQGLPAVTPVRLTVGGTRSGFEELEQVMTDRNGELSATVAVPSWTQRDRVYVFTVMNVYFRPIAASGIFHVTGPDGTVLREGRITDADGSCAGLRGAAGERYALVGDVEGLETGDAVTVEAKVVESTECGERTALDVVRVRRVPSDARPPRRDE